MIIQASVSLAVLDDESNLASRNEKETRASVATELTFYADSLFGQLSPDSEERTKNNV